MNQISTAAASHFDAAVIGTGPAGVQAASVMAKFGLRVLAVGAEAPHAGRKSGWHGLHGIASRLAEEALEGFPALVADVVRGEAGGLEWMPGLPGYSFRVGERLFSANYVVLATGVADGLFRLAGGIDLDVSASGRVEVDGGFVTSCSRLYAVGDLARGYGMTVQTALGSGHLAARAVAESFVRGRRQAA